ncbi:MAG TPA: bifunctional 4-hydroxy-2-oxoglutarate aldolase/2-dehydro-3-deoxy-phosphogluconate aldolase, partial [Actinomycetes bacterium]|nr:bifunctional 4-hydroxy-2-oxoglutarate aldolase/2-dehydro-3-deoxy-phosphogluconate aldolase [Actinomycetes bacterium]
MADVTAQLGEHRVVPVVVIDDAARAGAVADALVAGGLPVAEVTFRTAAAAEALRTMATRDDLLVGAGTVITAEQIEQAVAAGARFIVSPGLSRAVVRRAAELDVPVFPGVATASEVMAALDEGVSTVKFLPAETSGGVAAVKALAGPFPQVRFVPTGGIKAANALDYLALPAVVAVGGSWMVPAA